MGVAAAFLCAVVLAVISIASGDAGSCQVPLIEKGEMGILETTYSSWGNRQEFKKVLAGENVDSRQTLIFRCKENAIPVYNSQLLNTNSLEVTCNDGTWSKELQCKQAHCTGEPPPSKNARPIIVSREHGNRIYYTCTKRNVKKTAGNVTCHLGSWIGTPPKCVDQEACYTKDLNYPGLVKPAEEHFNSFENFEILCEEGYRKQTRDQKITCKRGQWEVIQNPCKFDEEDKSISSTEPGGNSFSSVKQPSVNVDTSTHPTSESNEDCFCTYQFHDPLVKAQLGERTLEIGDTIRLHERVSFECIFPFTILTWQNGARFHGKVHMICNTCKKWQIQDVPLCKSFEKSDTIISFYEDLNVLPGGIAIVQNGKQHTFFCTSTQIYPEWDYGQRKGVSVTSTPISGSGTLFYVTNLEFDKEADNINGTYTCYNRDGGRRRLGSTFLHLQVNGGCEIPKVVGGSLKEEKLGDWYWNWGGIRWERTLDYLTIQSGKTVSSGTVLWFYCNEPYSVHGNGERRIKTRCLKGRWSTELQCLLDGERLVTSTATSTLRWFTTKSEILRSSSGTTAEYSSPSTTPKFIEFTSPKSAVGSNPGAVVTSPPSPEPPAKECFCEYPVEDSNIVAHVDGKRLIYGDRVRNGSTVAFHCLHVGYHRFRGHREITCNDCQPWVSSDLPFCMTPKEGDAAILFNRDINVLPDGKIEINKGQSVNFTCVAMEIAEFPEWIAPETPGTSFIRERRERKDYGDDVYLTHLQIENAHYENEGTYECSIEGNHRAMLQVIITDPNLRCPELPEDGRVIIRYNMERRENSKATFSCSKKGQELIGQPVLTCLRSGEWSDPPPYCSGVRCEVLKSNDLLQIDYSNEREIGSFAAFHCLLPGKRSGVSLTHCLENGRWAHPTPTCKNSTCSIHDLSMSIPETVEPDMSNVTGENVAFGSEVKLKCTDNFVIIGDSKAQCEEKGKWKLGRFQCVRGCLLNLNPSSHLSVEPQGDVYRTGDSIILSCPPGEETSNNVYRMMCMFGGWSDTLPECVQKVKEKPPSTSGITNTNFTQGVQGCPLNLDPASHLIIEPKKDVYRTGDSITLACPPGEETSNNVERMMCMLVGWSETLPECVQKVEERPRSTWRI